MSFNINNKLIFVDSFQFLVLLSIFGSKNLKKSFKNLNKYDFKYVSQEFDSSILDLVTQKGFYPYEYMSDFEKFKEKLLSRENFYS